MRWAKGYDPEQLMDGLSACRTINADRSRQVSNFFKEDEWVEVLVSALEDESVAPPVKKAAIMAVAHALQRPNPQQFLDMYKEELRKFTAKKYIIVMPFWGRVSLLNASGISFDRRLDCRPLEDAIRSATISRREEFLKEVLTDAKLFGNWPDFSLEFFQVHAKSPEDAFWTVYDHCAAWLGLLNLIDGSFTLPMTMSGAPRSVHDLIIAPTATVHDCEGQLVTQSIYTDIWNPSLRPISRPSNDRVCRVKNELLRVQKAIDSSNWRPCAIQATQLFYNAFAEFDQCRSVVEAWKLVELICGDQNTKDAVLARRAAAVFEASANMSQVGEHFRSLRNTIVHGRDLIMTPERIVGKQFRDFIKPVLAEFLLNTNKFDKKEEFWDFLEGLREPHKIDSRRRVQRALDQISVPKE